MRVSGYGRQQVRPRDFWAAIVIVATLLIGAGLLSMGAGSLPKGFYAIGAACVAFGWLATLWTLVRRGRTAFSFSYLIFFVGYTLFFGEQLIPYFAGGRLARNSTVSLVGALFILPFILSPFVDLRKRRSPGLPPS